MGPIDAFEAVVLAGALPRHAARVAEMRRAFELRTGAFGPEDPWFEARSRAFWDDAVASQGFGQQVEADVAPAARVWVRSFDRAHRGLFEASREGDGAWLLRDVWGGAEFLVSLADVGTRDSLDAATSPFDARIVGRATPGAPEIAILPGAIFHPEDAVAPLEEVLAAAKKRDLSTDHVLDALLRMEKSFRSLSRVKPGYAYRAAALDIRPLTPPGV